MLQNEQTDCLLPDYPDGNFYLTRRFGFCGYYSVGWIFYLGEIQKISIVAIC